MLVEAASNINPKESQVGVIGLGFVGLPLALLFAGKGFRVTGIDLDKEKVDKINNGISYLPDIEDKQIEEAINEGNFKARNDYQKIKELDVIIICVPTPLTKYQSPDLSFLESVANSLAPHVQKEQLIVLESSTYPGTTTEVLQPILEKGGLKAGIDFSLAYSPERIDPGNKGFELEDIPKVISGVSDKCKKKIEAVYSKVFNQTVVVSSPAVAELTKLLENSYRFINISFINEIAMLCDTLKLDTWEVIAAASTKPYGFSPFFPGPGIGGHCIPVDPLYLSWKAKQYKMDMEFLNIATRINRLIPCYIVEQLSTIFSEEGGLSEKEILIMGVSYKKDIGDARESPAVPIIESLINAGANVSYHDSYVPELKIYDKTFKNSTLTDTLLQKADCILILTDHSNLPLKQMADKGKLIYDTRNVMKGLNGKAKIIRLGGGAQ